MSGRPLVEAIAAAARGHAVRKTAESACGTADRPRGRLLVVAVDGRSGSGKTSVARQLATELADLGTVALVHLDDVYAGWRGLAEAPRRVREQVCEPLLRGEAASLQRWDWQRGGYRGEVVELGRPDVLVVEGVGALARVLRPYLDLGVWLEVDAGTRYVRAIGRDGELFRPHWQEWAEQEDAYLASDDPVAAAGLVLRT